MGTSAAPAGLRPGGCGGGCEQLGGAARGRELLPRARARRRAREPRVARLLGDRRAEPRLARPGEAEGAHEVFEEQRVLQELVQAGDVVALAEGDGGDDHARLALAERRRADGPEQRRQPELVGAHDRVVEAGLERRLARVVDQLGDLVVALLARPVGGAVAVLGAVVAQVGAEHEQLEHVAAVAVPRRRHQRRHLLVVDRVELGARRVERAHEVGAVVLRRQDDERRVAVAGGVAHLRRLDALEQRRQQVGLLARRVQDVHLAAAARRVGAAQHVGERRIHDRRVRHRAAQCAASCAASCATCCARRQMCATALCAADEFVQLARAEGGEKAPAHAKNRR